MKTNLFVLARSLLTASACLVAATVPAHASGLIAGATEFTQILNNIELSEITIEQAETVIQQIKTVLNTAQTVAHGVQNLRNLPRQMLSDTIAPYRDQVTDLRSLLSAVNDVKDAAEATRAMVNFRVGDAKAMQMSMKEYLAMEVSLATKRGGIYRTRMAADMKAIDTLRDRADKLRALTNATQSIAGNIQGLQLLNQHASMQAGELMEIKSALLSANMDRSNELAEKADASTVKSDVMDATISGAKQRQERDKNTTYRATDPWRNTWSGMGQ